jgi:putative two-component system response regulator
MTNLLGGNTILVVEDDPFVLDLVAQMLHSEGATAIPVKSVAEARVELARIPEVYVVITDLHLPGESGLEFVRSLAADPADMAVIVASGEDDPELAATLIDLGVYGYLTKPFRMNDLVIGVRSALQRRALLLQNRRVHELREQASHRETINRLSAAAELRDLETGEHIVRIGEYSTILARAVGLTEDQVELLRIAAPMHDVGKIGIPDSILLKPGPLTAEERATMEQHAKIGYEILANSDVDLLSLGAQLALTHHERYDGCGYPNGLAGDQISIQARIVAIADVFDALTSDRVYRSALSVGDALELMRPERGKHFDPEIFDAFLQVLPEIVAVKLHVARNSQHPELPTADVGPRSIGVMPSEPERG